MEFVPESINKYKFYKEIATLPFVEKIVLFGSRARGSNLERSDIDLAVLCPKATDMDWIKVLDIIEEADTLLKIDCIRLDTLPLSSPLRKNIEQEGIIIYAKN